MWYIRVHRQNLSNLWHHFDPDTNAMTFCLFDCLHTDECVGQPVLKPCQNRGYQDPKNCHKCLCADGWAGDDCTELASSVGGKFWHNHISPVILDYVWSHIKWGNCVSAAPCGGHLKAGQEPQFITSPGYYANKNLRYYNTGQECNWLITVSNLIHFVYLFQLDCVLEILYIEILFISYSGTTWA